MTSFRVMGHMSLQGANVCGGGERVVELICYHKQLSLSLSLSLSLWCFKLLMQVSQPGRLISLITCSY